MTDIPKTLKDMRDKMQKAVDHVSHEFQTLHTGKANPVIVENIHVDAYGSMSPLKNVAGITTPDPRLIRIEPWDKGLLNPIASAIRAANIGLNPVVEGHVVRCPIPELSRERRQELVKSAQHMSEEGRVVIRGIRRDTLEKLKKDQKAGSITEDDLKRAEKDIQNDTDKSIALINKSLESKEKELTTI